MKTIRVTGFMLCILFAFILLPFSSSGETRMPNDPLVYVIPVEQTVERGLFKFLERGFEEAIQEGADHIVLDIHTPGGAVDSANDIAKLMGRTDIPITAYVNTDAISAGAYISLNADYIVMAPNARMGSAGIIDGAGNAADQKMQQYWLSSMQTAAELNDRDPKYAIAMASEYDLPEFGTGEFLTINASQALEIEYSEATVQNFDEVLAFIGLEDAHVTNMEVSFAEQIARFVTHPVVIPILLSIGSLGLVLELYSPGFGVPGIMGISALLLFFFGHTIAGFAGMEAILLFVVGVILILIEIFIAGFGLFGILGIISILAGMLMGGYSTAHMLISIVIAIVVTAVAAIILFRYFGDKGPWRKVVLQAATTAEEGYISNVTRNDLIGGIGEALTPLRPSGTAQIGEEFLDVVTEGRYIEQGTKVQVVKTSGSRIVVREKKSEI
ncbi:NfeD family protein [Alkalihalobacillus pseudalcaliphilus]|uniref:NfeD family protein n=1 Tax=Alkalihalobacillus pseudalcaliphilus TaxID=79884 RepID=UPI00064D8419|nr:nodulation protein NfeD [Alkalihalobacillus pseudalcaliphilus]KMK75950.1 membrane protein [Alkalihalobacillus pseudalcaliphilus]